MSGSQSFNAGNRDIFQIDTKNVKAGMKASAFAGNDALLEIFNASDKNKNKVLDNTEVSVFVNKVNQAQQAEKAKQTQAKPAAKKPASQTTNKPQTQAVQQKQQQRTQAAQTKSQQAAAGAAQQRTTAQKQTQGGQKTAGQQVTRQQAARKAQVEREAKSIATTMKEEIDEWQFNSIGGKDFQGALKRVNSGNVVETLAAYDEMSPKESLAEAISWEETSSNATIGKALTHILTQLNTRARQAGVSQSTIANFNKEANEFIKRNKASELDRVFQGYSQAIRNVESLGSQAAKKEASKSFAQHRSETIQVVNSQLKSARASLQNQKDSDGWAGKTVDWISGAWGSNNRASKVNEDINKYRAQNQELANCKTEAEFKTKFKQIYGVEYDPVAITAFKTKQTQYQKATTAYSVETSFNDATKFLQKNTELKAESHYTASPGGPGTVVTTATKQQVYDRELGNFAQILGMGDKKAGMEQINSELKKAGLENASIDQKYKFLSTRAKECSTLLHTQTMEATGGKSYQTIAREYKNSYAGAFGTKNDIARRVNEYNDSQQTGAMVLKSGIKIAAGVVIGVATGGAGVAPLLVAAGAQSAVSFAVDASDLATSKKGGTTEQYLTLAKNAAIDGASQVVSGGASQIIKGSGVSTAARYALNTATDTAVDMGVEYLQTGEVTWQSTLMSAAFSLGGQVVGDAIERRAQNKALDLGDIDESKLPDQNSGWLGAASEEHQITMTQAEVDQMRERSGFYSRTIAPGENIAYTADDIIAANTDVGKLARGGGMSESFTAGLVDLELRMRANGGKAARGVQNINGKGSNVRDWGAASTIGLSSETVQDAATLSAKAYSPKAIDASKVNGWNQVATQSAGNGFHAKAFEKDGTIIVAFRGSDDLGDLKVDHQMLSGRLPDQFADAKAFVEQIRQANPDAKIVVTGHSLGGSLAELTASQFDGVVGVTFDAVGTKGLVSTHGLKDNGNTVNYVVRGDIISNANEHVGTVVVTDGVGGQSQHAIGNFTGSGNSLVGVEGGLAPIDTRRLADTRSARAAKGATLDTAISRSSTGSVAFDDRTFRDVKSQFSVDVNSLNADLNALQAQVQKVSNPTQRAQLQKILDARKAQLAACSNQGIKSRSTVTKVSTGDEINQYLKESRGFDNPAFLPGQTRSIETIQLTQETRFVRVFNETGNPPSFAKGSWVMALEDIQGLTPEQIKDKFALPGMPSHVVELDLPAGTELITGACNPLEGWGRGGGTQYFITGEKSHSYSNIRELPKSGK
ncbi:hypothetical protein IJ843_07310 [bacterium]|nr:hypothetical protein [bacterium]